MFSFARDFTRRLVEILAVVIVYYVLGRLGLLLAISPGYATAVWPAAGVALGGVLMLGRHIWPGILLGSFLVNVWTSLDAASLETLIKTTWLPLFIGAGAALQAVAGAELIRRFVGYPNSLANEKDVIKFLALGGPVSCFLSSTWGVTTLWWTGVIPAADCLFSWFTWWVGDAIGAIIFAPLTLIWCSKPREVWRRRQFSVTAPLALTFALAVLLFVYARHWEDNRIKMELQRRADNAAQELTRHFAGYIDVLHSLEGFYASSGQVTRQSFQTFASRLLNRHPGIQVLSWDQRVVGADREAFEQEMRREGFENFEIKEAAGLDETRPAQPREEYVPVAFLEPLQGNERAVGFDVASDRERSQALTQARDTGRPVATGPVRLIQDVARDSGMVVYVPVYLNQSRNDSVEDRRRTLRGFVAGVFRISDLMSAALSSPQRIGLQIRIFDNTDPQRSSLLFDTMPKTGAASARQDLNRVVPLEVATRRWAIQFSPTFEYLQAQRTWQAWSILAGGLLFTGLLGAFLLVISGRTVAVEDLVAVRTSELQSSYLELQLRNRERLKMEQKFRGLLESAPDAIVIIGPDGTIDLVNSQTEKLFGYPRDELLGQPVELLIPQRFREQHRGQRNHFIACPETRIMGADLDLCGLHKNGTQFPVEISLSPLETEEGIFISSAVRDITARKKAEATLRQSEERFAKVFRSSPVALSISTVAEGRFLDVNEAFLNLFEYERAEILGHSSLELQLWVNPDDRAQYLAQLGHGESVRSMEAGFRKKSGQTGNGLISIELINLREQTCMVSIILDITERKRAEQALAESQALYYSLVEALPMSVFRKDTTGGYTFGNHRFCEVMGKSLDELLGKTVFDFYPRELAEKYARDDQNVLETGKVFEDVEEHVTESGDSGYNHIIKVPLRDASGSIVGLQGIFTDVTANKLAEEAVRQSEERFRQLSASAPIGIFETDVTGRCTYTNKRWSETTGLSTEESLAGGWIKSVHPDDRGEMSKRWNQSINQGTDFTHEFRLLRPTGEVRWVLARSSAIRSRTGKVLGFVGTGEDITELKQYEVELAKARDAALESARLKAEFLANMSHEIRTPMNGVVGMVNLLLDTSLNQEQRDYAETIDKSAEALLNIINDILDLSKIEAGKLTFETIDFDLRQTIDDTIELFSGQARAKRIELASLIYGDVPVALRGDPGRLRQVITNLLSNGVKFTDKGEVVLRATKEHETETSVQIRITVTDTGIGIAPQAVRRLFQAFTQEDGSTTRKYGGTGLGLAISKQLVERMGGQIWVESAPGKGSTFWFTASFEKQPNLSALLAQSRRPADDLQNTRSPSAFRILVAEDSHTNQKVTLNQLRKLGLRADLVANGLEVQQALEQTRYDVILMDCQMPEMDGYEATQRIRGRNGPQPYIIALTAHAMQGDREKCLDLGMDDYLGKPITVSQLESALKRAALALRSQSTSAANSVGLEPSMKVPANTSSSETTTPPLDLARLRDAFGDDAGLLHQTIALYLEEADQSIQKLAAAIQAKDSKQVKDVAHRMLGASFSCGATRMIEPFHDLEQRADNIVWDEASLLLEEAAQALAQTRQFAEELRP